jgi:hypothetical protein
VSQPYGPPRLGTGIALPLLYMKSHKNYRDRKKFLRVSFTAPFLLIGLNVSSTLWAELGTFVEEALHRILRLEIFFFWKVGANCMYLFIPNASIEHTDKELAIWRRIRLVTLIVAMLVSNLRILWDTKFHFCVHKELYWSISRGKGTPSTLSRLIYLIIIVLLSNRCSVYR